MDRIVRSIVREAVRRDIGLAPLDERPIVLGSDDPKQMIRRIDKEAGDLMSELESFLYTFGSSKVTGRKGQAQINQLKPRTETMLRDIMKRVASVTGDLDMIAGSLKSAHGAHVGRPV